MFCQPPETELPGGSVTFKGVGTVYTTDSHGGATYMRKATQCY